MITSDGVFLHSSQRKIDRQSSHIDSSTEKIFDLKKKLLLRIIKSDVGGKEEHFIVRISEEKHSKDVHIQGVNQL